MFDIPKIYDNDEFRQDLIMAAHTIDKRTFSTPDYMTSEEVIVEILWALCYRAIKAERGEDIIN